MSAGLAPPIARLETASAQSVMERVAEAGLIERGAVAVISVGAIRDRVGERWPRKRDDVWAYVGRKMHEHLSAFDIHHRLNETDFLLAMTGEHGAVVQGVALRVLEEVLVFFLGAAEMPDIRIQTVTSFSGGGLSCAPVDPTRISRAPVARETTARPVVTPKIDPVEEAKRNPFAFKGAGGKDLRIDFSVEPMVNLKQNVTAAIRIEPRVSYPDSGDIIPVRNFALLSDDDLHMIDRATFNYAALFLSQVGSKETPLLVVPASFRTLGARKGRNALTAAAGALASRLKGSVLIELVDVDRGTPGSRLTEVAGLLESLCRGVFIRLHPGKDMATPVRGFRYQGLTVDAQDLGVTDTQIATQLLAFGEQARGLAPILVAQGLANEGFIQVAMIAGLTHAALRTKPVTAED